MESGTGTGKTICSLAGALAYAKASGKKVIYLTRTISQGDQVMKELRNIAIKHKVSGLPMVGRLRSCLLLRSLDELENLSPHALAIICEEKKKKSLAKEKGGCPHYEDYNAIGDVKFSQLVMNKHPTADEFDRFCEMQGACPYEARKALIPTVDVLVLPYVHMLSEDIRQQLLDRMDTTAENIVIIIDEAHNLADAARESESFGYKMIELDSVDTEVGGFGNARLTKGVDIRTLLGSLRAIVTEASHDQIPPGKTEGRLGRKFLEGQLRSRLKMTDEAMRDLTVNLVNEGEAIVDRKLELGKEPVSATLRLGAFLDDWFNADDHRFLKTVSLADGGTLHASCLEPRSTMELIKQCHGAVHMSGTLCPLEQYRDVLDLPMSSELKAFPSPFPPQNKLVLYVDDVNCGLKEMRADPGMQEKIEAHIIDICNATKRNTMVFFRSYEMLRTMRPKLSDMIDRELYWEAQGPSRQLAQNIDKFKSGKNGVFFTVMGGKVSEGLDFPGKELDLALIVGIPYPPPSQELEEMRSRYDQKYGQGKGWEYTSEVPALRKVQQAIGRLIRTEKDRGAAVILDARAGKYKDRLGAILSKKPALEISQFLEWGERPKAQ